MFMLKIVNRNCAGIDVHKKIIVVTTTKTNEHDITDYQTKSFNTFTEELIKCHDWLVSNDTLDVCMESTGKYWIPVFNILEENANALLLILNMLDQYQERKLTRKILFGLQICLSMA